MIVVIQCAARKRPDAGFLRNEFGDRVAFVARPDLASQQEGLIYARPDDPASNGRSWRDELVAYNESGRNPFGLLPAAELYCHDAYRRIGEKFGIDKTYILSAGWGLISGSFLTPYYDVTFSAAAVDYKRRRKWDPYGDLNMLPPGTEEPIVFFGGKDYLPLFCDLTRNMRSARTIFYNSAQPPSAVGCSLVRYETATRTNWHYECVDAVLAERIRP